MFLEDVDLIVKNYYNIPILCFFAEDMDPTFPHFHSIFLIDIGPTLKISQHIRRSCGMFRPPTFSKNIAIVDIQDVEICPNNIQIVLGMFLYSLKYVGVSKVENNWFRESWTRPHEHDGVLGVPKASRKVSDPK